MAFQLHFRGSHKTMPSTMSAANNKFDIAVSQWPMPLEPSGAPSVRCSRSTAKKNSWALAELVPRIAPLY